MTFLQFVPMVPLPGRRWLLAIGVAAVAAVTAAAWLTHRGAPQMIDTTIARHATATRDDTARVARAVAVADTVVARAHAVAGRRDAHASDARIARANADSIRTSVTSAPDGSDSLAAWQQAYDARTTEAAAVQTSLAASDSVTQLMTIRADSLASALAVTEVRAARADSVIPVIAKVARPGGGDGCRLLRLIPCPGRKALVGSVVVAIAIGRR